MTLKRDQPMVSQGTVVEKGKVGKYLAFRMLHLTLVNIRKLQRIILPKAINIIIYFSARMMRTNCYRANFKRTLKVASSSKVQRQF